VFLDSCVVPNFCRHGRLEANCPICSKGVEQRLAPARRPVRRASAAASSSPSVAARRRAARGSSNLRVSRVERAADDGYEHDLVPGLRATADAARLADELAFSVARLDELGASPPGLYAEVTAAADPEEAVWLALQIAYLSPLEGVEDPFASIAAVRTSWASGDLPDVDGASLGPRTAHAAGRGRRTLEAYRAWVGRAGSQSAALTADASWGPERRFERAFERLALPGFARGPRYELLVLLGRLGAADLRPTSLHVGEATDPTTGGAKRVFGIGDAINLRRRSAELATAAQVPIEALDLALVNWTRPLEERVSAAATVSADPARRAWIAALLGVGEAQAAPAD
jgi:hypothetical protein